MCSLRCRLRIAEFAHQIEEVLTGHTPMKLDREFRAMLPQDISHPFQDLDFHSLNVDFDSVDAVFRSTKPRPQPIEARREKPLFELLAFERTVDHPTHHRKTSRGEISALSQPDGNDCQLLKSVSGPSS